VPIAYLELGHRVVRYVPWAKLRKDEDDNVIGVLGVAFKLRPGEPYLSATWVEYFRSPDPVVDAIITIRGSEIDVRPKSGFAVGAVHRIDEECKLRRRRIRFVHEASEDNKAHAALRGWPEDDDELLECLAEDAWSHTILNSSIP
jgi:hypothetical protein